MYIIICIIPFVDVGSQRVKEFDTDISVEGCRILLSQITVDADLCCKCRVLVQPHSVVLLAVCSDRRVLSTADSTIPETPCCIFCRLILLYSQYYSNFMIAMSDNCDAYPDECWTSGRRARGQQARSGCRPEGLLEEEREDSKRGQDVGQKENAPQHSGRLQRLQYAVANSIRSHRVLLQFDHHAPAACNTC